MAASTTLCLTLLLLLLLFLLAPTLRTSHADMTFITNTCKNTQRPDYCVSTLKSVNRSINATSVVDLTRISVDIVTSDASSLFSYIDNLADQNIGTPLEAPLNECLEIYGNALDDLREAQDELNSQDYDSAESSVERADDAPDNCEGAFDEVNSPIKQRNQSVKDHCDLCSDLIDLLVG